MSLQHHPVRRLWIIPLLLLFAASSVYAQEWSSPSSSWHNPEFTNPRTTILFVWLIIWFPFWIIGSVLLWRRRKHFPIAGRGANYLLGITANMFFFFYLIGIVGLGWPLGPPCSIFYLYNMCSTFLLALTYTIRGWILVFRLEIQQFLTETRWREEKKELKEKHQAMKREDSDSPNLAIKVQDEDPTDVTTLPGYFFIRHRNWIEAKFIRKFLAGTFLVCVISMMIIILVDPDPILTDAVLHSRGDLPAGETTGNQFSSSNFLHAPACLVYSSKQFVYLFLFSGIGMPIVFWIIWRLFLDKGRTTRRNAEKAAFHLSLLGTVPPSAVATSPAAPGGIRLDDVESVKKELSFAISGAVGGSIAYFLMEPFEPGYMTYIHLSLYPLLLVASVLLPLRQSYAVSARTRALIDSSRHSEKNVNKIDVHNRLPHQKPYFTLKFILKNPATYPILLKFLQQEWSSENALFWTEAKEFSEAATALESKILTWPSAKADRDEDSDVTSIKPSTNKMVNTASRRAANDSPTSDTELQTSSSSSSHQLFNSNTVPSSSVTQLENISETAEVELGPVKPSDSSLALIKQMHIEANRLKSWALHICSNYLAQSSMYEVNIAEDLSKMVQAQVRTLQQWEPTPGYQASTSKSGKSTSQPAKGTLTETKAGGASQPDPLVEESLRIALDRPDLTYPSSPPFPLSMLYRSTNLAVFELIQRDSFRRFILTTSFSDLLAKADEEEMQRVEKQQDLAHEGQEAEQAMSQALAKLSSPATPSNRPAPQKSPASGPQGNSDKRSLVSNSRFDLLRHDSSDPISAAAIDGHISENLPGMPQTISPTTIPTPARLSPSAVSAKYEISPVEMTPIAAARLS